MILTFSSNTEILKNMKIIGVRNKSLSLISYLFRIIVALNASHQQTV